MNKPENHNPTIIEDLRVDEVQQEAVKGGFPTSANIKFTLSEEYSHD